MSITRLGGRARTALGPVAAVVALVAALAAPTPALAETTLEYEPSNNPVADNITRLEVNKLERGSRDYVVGARMCIIDEETGETVFEWVSDGTTQEVARELDVEKVYILRELSAPEGYATAADTRFILHSVDFNTKGEVIAGPDAEFSEVSGSGETQAFVINLYDEALVNQEKVVHQQTSVTKKLPQTSDLFDPTLVYALGAAGLSCISAGIHTKRR